MPNKTIPILGFSCAAVFTAYLALVIAAIFFATWETKLSAAAADAESRIAALETDYYDAIAVLNNTNVASAGFARPDRVDYVAENGKPTVTFAPKATR